MPSGATSIGCQGRNHRASLNGHSHAMPSPPFVAMSTRPCEAHETARNATTRALGTPVRRANHGPISSATKTPKAIECVQPRWPHQASYGTPAKCPIASRSGAADASEAATSSERWRSDGAQQAISSGIAGWEKQLAMVGGSDG